MYQLYYSPGACSMAVHVILNELNQPVELHRVSLQEGDNRKPEFLKINPRGQVPVLVDDGLSIREGAAQIIYLLDKHKSPLLPASGKERAVALEWLCYANASLHPAYSRAFFLKRNAKDEAAKAELMKIAVAAINKMWADVDAHLAKNKYLAGDNLTAADILISVFANWESWLPLPTVIGANTKRLIKEVISRPSYQKALETEQVEYKAA
jgi:glutathione S-transferase